MRRIIAILLAVLTCSCSYQRGGTYFTSGIRGYKGDGTIEDTSQRSGFFNTRGYLVSLPRFSLDKPYKNTFRLDGLPTINGRSTEIVFLVPETFSRDRAANTNSVVEFSLVRADGTEVVHVRSALGALIWSGPVHGRSGSALYQFHESFFKPVPGEAYQLRVTYSPASGAAEGEGYFYLWCGVGGS
jgi:hypothetical protein